MSSDLTAEIASLCEKASREQDSHKLLELTKQINHLLEIEENKRQALAVPTDGHAVHRKSA